ncbi:MAG: FtsX-like permease family protein [Myxococcota bacterium]
MGALASVAVRNILRNKRRTMLTLLAIILGVAATIFVHAFVGGFLGLITNVLVQGRVGAIQVHRKGFLDAETDPLRFDLPHDDALMQKLRAVPGVAEVTPRIVFEAMLSNGAQSTMALVTAVHPPLERRVCPQRWAAVRDKDFVPQRPGDSLVGRFLLEGLSAKDDDVLTMSATTQAGASNALDLRVVSPLGTTDPLMSKRMVEVDLGYAQELLTMSGRVTEYAVALQPGAQIDVVAEGLRNALGPDMDVHTWLQLLPEVADGVDSMGVVLWFVVALLFLLVLSGIANTMLMAVHERTREIGTMLAMGIRRRQILGVFLVESLALGVVGGVVGGILGFLIVSVTNHTGIPLKPPESEIDNFLRPATTVAFVLSTMAGAGIGAVIAAIQPARRAARLSPVEALRNE